MLKKARQFFLSSPLRKLQWEVRLEGKRPALSHDLWCIYTESTGERNRLDVIGPGGIGKSWFTSRLTKKLGRVWPVNAEEHSPLPDDWAEAIQLFLLELGERFGSPGVSFGKQLERMDFRAKLLHLETEMMTKLSFGFAINTESLARHELEWFANIALGRPEFVSTLMKDRLLLVCSADQPADRVINGLKARGKDVTDTLEKRASIDKRLRKTLKNVSILESLGVPVLVINLDMPIRQNVAIVARFLSDNQVTSPRIRKWAKRAH